MSLSLENILQASEACLEMVEGEQYTELEKKLLEGRQLLEGYLHSINIASIEGQQLTTLQQIDTNYKQAIQLIKERKHTVVERVSVLKKGRKMAHLYNN